jgi:uncharacterized protein (DUF1697 family)
VASHTVASGMPRYAAFLRGVMPTNARMADLRKSFEAAGFTHVSTVLSSGNVLFDARAAPGASLERRAEAAMKQRLGRAFLAIVRPVDALRALVADDPYRGFGLPPHAKRIVTFLRTPADLKVPLPVEVDGARILCVRGGEALGAYVRTPRGPVFMTLIERTFGKDVTTRTWETVRKVAG